MSDTVVDGQTQWKRSHCTLRRPAYGHDTKAMEVVCCKNFLILTNKTKTPATSNFSCKFKINILGKLRLCCICSN